MVVVVVVVVVVVLEVAEFDKTETTDFGIRSIAVKTRVSLGQEMGSRAHAIC